MRTSGPDLVEQLLDVVETLRITSAVLGLGLADFAEEERATERAELGLVPLVPLRIAPAPMLPHRRYVRVMSRGSCPRHA
jgi:hypothetical protein